MSLPYLCAGCGTPSSTRMHTLCAVLWSDRSDSAALRARVATLEALLVRWTLVAPDAPDSPVFDLLRDTRAALPPADEKGETR